MTASPQTILTNYLLALFRLRSDTGMFSPYDFPRPYFQSWSMLGSDEICRSNLWYYVMTHLDARVIILDNHARSLETVFTGLPSTHPREMAKLGPVYRQWQPVVSNVKPVWQEYRSRLSTAVHRAIRTSGVSCLLLNLCPLVPYFPPNHADEREMDLKEHQLASKLTLDLLAQLNLPIITLFPRAEKICKLAKLDTKLCKASKKKGWSAVLAQEIRSLVKL